MEMQETPGKEGISIFVSPKRKRVLSPHNCAKISKEYPLTHIPKHREFCSNIEDGSELSRTIEPCDDPRFDLAWTVGDHSPETTTFLRRQNKTPDDDYLGFGSTQKRDIFGKIDNSYSSDDEKDTVGLKQEPQLPKKYEETKRSGKCGHRGLDGDGEGDAGTESDFSGVAGRMSTLSVGKRPSSFAAFSRKTSPGSSPSSQDSSLNSSLALSPSRPLCHVLQSQLGMDCHMRGSICTDASPRKWNRRSSADDPFANMYDNNSQQPQRRREKTNKLISSALLSINGPMTPSLDSDSSNNTYLSGFHKSVNTSGNNVNHTAHTDALYNASFRSDKHSELHRSTSGPASNRSPPSSSSGCMIWRHALGSIAAGTSATDPHTPFTPFMEGVRSSSNNMRVGALPLKTEGSADDWALGMPLDARESPVLTPYRKRQPSQSNAQSQSMTLSQHSHEEAMGDLGTPVTEVGSPAVLDDLDDLQEDEAGEEDGGRPPSGRVLFGGCGSLFQDEEDGNDGELTRDLSEGVVKQNENDCDDPEMVMIASNAGTKHTLDTRCASDNAQKCLPPHQRIRTFSPFVGERSGGEDVVLADDNDCSHESSLVCDDDLEYHLFAQQFMSSPSRRDAGEAVLSKSGTGRYEHTRYPGGLHTDHMRSPGREKLGLDFSGNTTGMSMTRSSSDTLMISKSSGEDCGSISQNTSSYMDSSTSECNHSLGSATARPLPDQSAFDGPMLVDHSHNSQASSLFDPPLFASPSNLRKRRPGTQYIRHAPNSPSSAECSPENSDVQAYSGSVGRLWGTSGSLGSPQCGVFADTSRPQNHIPTSVLSLSLPDGSNGTPSTGGIAIPGSADSTSSSCSGGSDILMRVRQGSHNFDASCSGGKSTKSCTGGMEAPFASLSHRIPGLVRQSSLMDTKVLLSQSEDDAEFSRRVNFREDFEEVGLLGSGTFADVYKVRQKQGGAPGAFYAVKKSKRQFRSKRDREWLMAEVRTMKLLGQQSACAYVVPFIRAWQEDSYFYVQMGYAERGTLRELLIHLVSPPKRSGTIANSTHCSNNITGCLPVMADNTVWHVVHDVCAGLQHIHSCGMVHLDIKPANLLITESGTLQIGDFGMAAAIGSCDDGNEGDTRYMAEELLNNTERLPSADMFSLGLTLFEICCFYATVTTTNSGNPGIMDEYASSLRLTVQHGLPSNGSLWHNLREDNAPPLPKQRDSTLQQLVAACMKRDPTVRPTAVQVLGMPKVAETLDDVDPVLLCAPRHDDVRCGRAGVPFLARSASMQAIESLAASNASSSEGQQGLRITVGPDNQIDYAALGDGAFTPSFSHGHSSYSPLGN